MASSPRVDSYTVASAAASEAASAASSAASRAALRQGIPSRCSFLGGVMYVVK